MPIWIIDSRIKTFFRVNNFAFLDDVWSFVHSFAQWTSYWDSRSGICSGFTSQMCWSSCCWCWAWGTFVTKCLVLIRTFLRYALPICINCVFCIYLLGQRTGHLCICYLGWGCSLQWRTSKKSYPFREKSGMFSSSLLLNQENISNTCPAFLVDAIRYGYIHCWRIFILVRFLAYMSRHGQTRPGHVSKHII